MGKGEGWCTGAERGDGATQNCSTVSEKILKIIQFATNTSSSQL